MNGVDDNDEEPNEEPKDMRSDTTASQADKQLESAPSTADRQFPQLSSDELLQGARKVVIVHRGEEYVLQVTRAGRLILTK